jgi:hypothetical protein
LRTVLTKPTSMDDMIDLRDYSRSNWNGLRNYAAETRQRRKISSAMAESAMSHLVNQRMGKRQPMERRDEPVWSRG